MEAIKGSNWGRLPVDFRKSEPIGPVVNDGVPVTKLEPVGACIPFQFYQFDTRFGRRRTGPLAQNGHF